MLKVPKSKMARMAQTETTPNLLITLTEWDHVGPMQDQRLRGRSLGDNGQVRQLADSLRRRVDIREGYSGLEIATTSFVGRIDVGPLRIAIVPKLPALPLARLLRYAYGLRDVATIGETESPTVRQGLHDLLISLLAAEVEELLHGGLARKYVPLLAKLESPRGRILIDEVIRQGGVREAKLPCGYSERQADWHLNQVLRAGLEMAAHMAEDRDLRLHVHQLSSMFRDVKHLPRLHPEDVERAERDLTRLTASSRPALTIIRLLQETLGIAVDSSHPLNRMPGFLFDMNAFFQRLLSRFLHDNLTADRIVDEIAIRGLFAYVPDANPNRRRAPKPRPDFALFRNNDLRGFLDAKYRDIWEKGLPAEWLYQLSIYALASPSELSVLLYASMTRQALDERIEVQPPVAWSSRPSASVILRPVPLAYLAELLDPDRASPMAAARHNLANELVSVETRRQPLDPN
jgi:5-methylcytosine-specific restriction enzyme subunit McrC